MTRGTLKILIALDGSKHSQAAISEVIARQYSLTVAFRLLHVLEPFNPIEPTASTSREVWASWVDNVRKVKRDDALKLLLEATQTIKSKFPDSEILSELAEGILPDQTIIDSAKAWGANLIVLGCRGNRGLKRFLLGSISNSVLQHAHCSVEIVKTDEILDSSARAIRQENVLVAIDDSTFSDAAIEMLLIQDWPDYASIKLITAMRPSFELFACELSSTLSLNLDDEQKYSTEKTRNWLAAKADQIARKCGTELVSIEVLIGDAREAILRFASDWPADLIVMGSHSRRGFSKFLLGSVSQTVALHSECSVQVIKLPLLSPADQSDEYQEPQHEALHETEKTQ